MRKVDIFKDYISLINSDKDKIVEALDELESLLCDSAFSHQRIIYLQELSGTHIDYPDTEVFAFSNPLNREQYGACIEKGIIKAYQDGDVSAEQLMKLAHSVDGLRAFTDALVEISEKKHASVFKEALAVPFKVVGRDIRKKINFIIADDIREVRDTFNRFLDLYKSDIEDGFSDDHLRYILGSQYEIELIEAADGIELEEKVEEKFKTCLSDYFVCFVDEDMPRKRGTAAISSISKSLDKYTPHSNADLQNRPRIKFVSYTQKQDIDISEEIAKASGADLFFRKTGLDNFYVEIVQIFEHLVLDSINLAPAPVMDINGNVLISVIGANAESDIQKYKEYLNFRYINEVWSCEITRDDTNHNWFNPDYYDNVSIPIGIYTASDEGGKLIACLRMITSQRQPQAELLEKALKSADYEMPGTTNNIELNDNELIIDKAYLDKSFRSYNLFENLLEYTCALALHLGKSTISWDIPDDLLSTAKEFGFKKHPDADEVSRLLYYNLSDAEEITGKKIKEILAEIDKGEMTISKHVERSR